MGFLDFFRNLRRRQQAEKTEERREVELGERVNPELLKHYQKPDEWAKLNPYEQEQLRRAMGTKR